MEVIKKQDGIKKIRHITMAVSNCLFSPTFENPCGFSAWCVIVKLSAIPRNYSWQNVSRHSTRQSERTAIHKSTNQNRYFAIYLQIIIFVVS